MQQHGSRYFAPPLTTPHPPPPGPLGIGSNGQNITFSEHMVMLHIKLQGITKCSNMVANIFTAEPRPWGWGQ